MSTAVVAHADSNKADSNKQIAETLGLIDGVVSYCVSVDPTGKHMFAQMRRDLYRWVGVRGQQNDDVAKSSSYRTAFTKIQGDIRESYGNAARQLCVDMAKAAGSA